MSSQDKKVSNKKAIDKLIAQQKYKSVSTRIDIPQPSSATTSKRDEFDEPSERSMQSLNSSQRIKQIMGQEKVESKPAQKTATNKSRHLSNNLSIDDLSELKSHRDALH